MKANELRIGNWYEFDEEPTQWSWQTMKDMEFEDEHIGEPIHLTPEILEKAGFENNDGEFNHPNNTDFDLIFSCSENGLWCAYNLGNGQSFIPFIETIPGSPVLNPICNPFKYLHQLQNLYFALTGDELEGNYIPVGTGGNGGSGQIINIRTSHAIRAVMIPPNKIKYEKYPVTTFASLSVVPPALADFAYK